MAWDADRLWADLSRRPRNCAYGASHAGGPAALEELVKELRVAASPVPFSVCWCRQISRHLGGELTETSAHVTGINLRLAAGSQPKRSRLGCHRKGLHPLNVAQIVHRISGRDGTVTSTGKARRVSQRFPDTKEGREAATRLGNTLSDVERFYDVRVRAHGRVLNKSFRRRKDADAWAVEAEAQRLRGVVRDPRRGHVALEQVAEGVAESQFHKTGPLNRARTKETLTTRTPGAREDPVAAITRADVQSLVDRWSSSGLSASTVSRTYSTLRALLITEAADLIERSPCRAIRLPRVPLVDRPFLEPEELERLAESLPPQHALFMWI